MWPCSSRDRMGSCQQGACCELETTRSMKCHDCTAFASGSCVLAISLIRHDGEANRGKIMSRDNTTFHAVPNSAVRKKRWATKTNNCHLESSFLVALHPSCPLSSFFPLHPALYSSTSKIHPLTEVTQCTNFGWAGRFENSCLRRERHETKVVAMCSDSSVVQCFCLPFKLLGHLQRHCGVFGFLRLQELEIRQQHTCVAP